MNCNGQRQTVIASPGQTHAHVSQKVMTEAALRHELTERMEEMTVFLDEQPEAVTEYSDALVRRLVEKVTVYDDKITVEFKSGLETEVDA